MSAATGPVMASVAQAPITAWLACPVAPGRTTTMLCLGLGGVPVLSLAATEPAGAVLDALLELVTAAEADDQVHAAEVLAASRAQSGRAR